MADGVISCLSTGIYEGVQFFCVGPNENPPPADLSMFYLILEDLIDLKETVGP